MKRYQLEILFYNQIQVDFFYLHRTITYLLIYAKSFALGFISTYFLYIYYIAIYVTVNPTVANIYLSLHL